MLAALSLWALDTTPTPWISMYLVFTGRLKFPTYAFVLSAHKLGLIIHRSVKISKVIGKIFFQHRRSCLTALNAVNWVLDYLQAWVNKSLCLICIQKITNLIQFQILSDSNMVHPDLWVSRCWFYPVRVSFMSFISLDIWILQVLIKNSDGNEFRPEKPDSLRILHEFRWRLLL